MMIFSSRCCSESALGTGAAARRLAECLCTFLPRALSRARPQLRWNGSVVLWPKGNEIDALLFKQRTIRSRGRATLKCISWQSLALTKIMNGRRLHCRAHLARRHRCTARSELLPRGCSPAPPLLAGADCRVSCQLPFHCRRLQWPFQFPFARSVFSPEPVGELKSRQMPVPSELH